MTEQLGPAAEATRRRPAAGPLLVAIAGGAVCVALGALSALYEAFYSNLRAGSVLVPVTLLVAFAANVALTRFAWFAVGARWSPALAIVPWVVVMIAAVSQRPEGDWVMLPDNWSGALTIVAGMVGFALPFLRYVTPARRI